jgi:hypothetical protein
MWHYFLHSMTLLKLNDQEWLYTQSNITSILFTWVHYTNTESTYSYLLSHERQDSSVPAVQLTTWIFTMLHSPDTGIVLYSQLLLAGAPCAQASIVDSTINREFKLPVSGNGKRHVRTFLAKFSLNVFVSYFLSCVERIIMYFSFKTASSFTLYCLIP